jgi:hypothetical protein
VGDLQVPLEREYTRWAWHLEYQVGVVGHRHELGDGRSAEDGMVGSLEVRDCRMDLPGPTTSVGTRTDYSVGPLDYPACATRHLKAWSTRTT